MRVPKGGIAFFDSGIGGLTLLADCVQAFPEEIFYYYGDNKNAPYGNLPPRKIRRYVFRAFKRFKRLKVQAAVLACNTATAVCIDELRKQFSFPIIGVEPAVRVAAKRGGNVLVLTTRATYNSQRFKRLCAEAQNCYPKAKVVAYPCDHLAGEIELGEWEKIDLEKHLPKQNPVAVVLGCTHYIYVGEKIAKFYDCEVYDGNAGAVKRLRDALTKNAPKKGVKNEFSKKNWDERPPFAKDREKRPFLPPKIHQEEQKNKTNKRSQKMTSNMQKRGSFNVFYLRKAQNANMRSFLKWTKNRQKSEKGRRWLFGG